MDGGVVISPRVTRKKEQIDSDGNKVKPFTKQVIEREEPPYKPTSEEIAGMAAAATRPPGKPSDALKPAEPARDNLPQPEAPKPDAPIEQNGPKSAAPAGGLAGQIKKMVNDAVQEALASIDIKGLVAEAIKEAFKDISL
jgi:hypothetical protein